MEATWRVEMLGTLQAICGEVVVTRFRTRRVTLLLAYLVCGRNRVHSREEIGELLWPEADPEVIRRNLRQALSSLRRVLEPPPVPGGAILQVEQSRLRLNPALVTSDLAEFESAIENARRKAGTPAEIAPLREAVRLYRGELLPGFYEDWILHEQRRLDDLYLGALRRLIEHSRAAGGGEETLHYLRLALDKERLNEEWHIALMREYLALDRPANAVEQFGVLREQLRKHLRCDPSETAYELLNRARRALRIEAKAEPPSPNAPLPEAGSIETSAREEPAVAHSKTSQVVRLPIQITRMCGREREVEGTLDRLLLRRARLVTLVGPAGTGKTRLSIEVGRRCAERRPGHVWFVPLADLPDAAMIPDAILDVLRARRSPHRDPIENLRGAARDDATGESETHLLILDNLEHILDDAVPIVAEILARVPNIQILVTTRRVLNVGGEHLIPVPPLPIPPTTKRHDPVDRDEVARLAGYPSVQLFLDRCQALRPDFGLTIHNARAIAAICTRLEGIPLAIELAAGLSGAFTPGQMIYHLDRRLTALTSRKRDTPARHRSLSAAVAYSYETLTPDLQRLFAALSVFRGGFGVEAAHHVCRDTEESASEREAYGRALEMILDLQERSLLYAEGADHEDPSGASGSRELRFRMLDSFREAGAEHLSASETRALRRRHVDFYRSRPLPPVRPLTKEEGTERHLWIESEFDNYAVALAFSLEEGEFEPAIELLETLRTTWTSRGPREVERRFIREIAERLETHPVDPVTHISLLRMLGTTHIRVSEYASAYHVCRDALAIAERHELTEQIAVCLSAISTCAGYLGRLDECLELNERVLRLVPEESLGLRERALIGCGAVHWGRGDLTHAEACYRQAAEVSVRLHDGEIDTLLLANLARVAMDAGAYDESMTRLGETMRICRRVHDEFGLALALSLVSRYHWLQGHAEAALSTGYEALLKVRECDFHHFSLTALFQHALVLSDRDESAATTLLAATQGMGRAARAVDAEDEDRARARLRDRLSPVAYERAWAKGLAMNTDEAFRLALAYK